MKKWILIGSIVLSTTGYAKTFECHATSSLFGEINMVLRHDATQDWVKESPLDNRTKAAITLKFDDQLYFIAEAAKADNGSYEQITITIVDQASNATASTFSQSSTAYLRLDFPLREVDTARTDRLNGHCLLK